MKSKVSILHSCSYERWLEKGFVVIKNTDNKLIKNIGTLKNYKDVILKFVDGKAKASDALRCLGDCVHKCKFK